MPNPHQPCSPRSTAVRICLIASVTLSAAVVSPLGAGTAGAQEENKILSITKNALYGGAAGMLLGGVTALVVREESRDDAIRWGIVIGTFGGFAYGIYDQSHQPSEYSLRLPAEETHRSATVEGALAAFRGEETPLSPGSVRPGGGAQSLGGESASPFSHASSPGASRRDPW